MLCKCGNISFQFFGFFCFSAFIIKVIGVHGKKKKDRYLYQKDITFNEKRIAVFHLIPAPILTITIVLCIHSDSFI